MNPQVPDHAPPLRVKKELKLKSSVCKVNPENHTVKEIIFFQALLKTQIFLVLRLLI